MRTAPVLFIVVAACSSPPGQDAGPPGCPDGSYDFIPFSVCTLTKDSTEIVYARSNGSTPALACEVDVALNVTRSLKGGRDGGTFTVLAHHRGLIGPLSASASQDGLFFLAPHVDAGRLVIYPTGGYFWQSQGRWQNAGKYVDAGLTTAELEALIADTDSGCPFP